MKVLHARGAKGREGWEGSVARAMERDRCAVPLVTSPHSHPLDQRVNNQELTREACERATGLMTPSKTGQGDEASEADQLPSGYLANTADFACSVAMRSSEVGCQEALPDLLHGGESSTQLTHSVTNTPKIMLTPLPRSSRSTPGSSFTGETNNAFLSDYW